MKTILALLGIGGFYRYEYWMYRGIGEEIFGPYRTAGRACPKDMNLHHVSVTVKFHLFPPDGAKLTRK